MFLAKKIIGHLFLPLPFLLALLVVGVCLARFTRAAAAGRIMAICAVVLLLLFSLPPLPQALLASLEHRYPYLSDQALRVMDAKTPIRSVVVLGAVSLSTDTLPLAEQIKGVGLRRLRAGIHYQRLLPHSRLVLSGGKPFEARPEAEVMAAAARDFAVPAGAIVLEAKSRDTAEEAAYLRPLLGQAPFLLVTSASHMPRAMAIFQRYGLHPIAAPTDYSTTVHHQWTVDDFFPSPANLALATRAIYEYLGLILVKLSPAPPPVS